VRRSTARRVEVIAGAPPATARSPSRIRGRWPRATARTSTRRPASTASCRGTRRAARVTAAAGHDNGRWSVADPREHGASSAAGEAARGDRSPRRRHPCDRRHVSPTVHDAGARRAAKSLVDPDEILELDGSSDSAHRVGKTGSGKTSTAKLAIEQVVAEGARVCILDPIKSDWWGLTSSADGKRPGLPFHILGGPRGHVPLHASAGKAIGEIVANGALPLSIIDMADFEPGGQAKFFTDFAPTLLRKMRGVVYLVIEEAHLFAPKERSGIGAENLSIHWAKTLATAGRSKGIRLMW
jgi:hypothetical protein